MNSSKTLEKIKQDLVNKKISTEEASELLISLIETSEDKNYRAQYIEEFGNVALKIEKNFKFLENYLVSDESPLVRRAAAKTIMIKFPKSCHQPLRWVIQNDKSIMVLKTIIEFLGSLKDIDFDFLLRNLLARLSEIYQVIPQEARFLLDLEAELNPFLEIGFFKPVINNRHVTALDLVGRKLKKLPPSISFLTFLQHLNLWDNDLMTLPPPFESLLELKALYLDWNKFITLPDLQWKKLKSLEKLSITNNFELNSIPKSLFSLVKNNFASKYKNEGVNSEEAPALGLLEILTGMKLKRLTINENRSNLYACNYRINEEGKVLGIYLYGYHSFQITFIPEQICLLKHLEELVLRDQNIQAIPDFIKKYKSLRHLDLMRNQIEFVPNFLSELKSLKSLDLGENKIQEIPTSIKSSGIDIWL